MGESMIGDDHKECCMCGDLGFPNALFHCRICHFRSQHRYCSDLYPKAESYRICNWCLHDKENRPASLSIADDSSASSGVSSNGSHASVMGSKGKFGGFDRRLSVQIQTVKKKKLDHDHKNQEEAVRKTPSMADDGKKEYCGRRMEKRSSSFGAKEELIPARTKDQSNAKIGSRRPIGRGKVRRYKLLEEVSS